MLGVEEMFLGVRKINLNVTLKWFEPKVKEKVPIVMQWNCYPHL